MSVRRFPLICLPGFLLGCVATFGCGVPENRVPERTVLELRRIETVSRIGEPRLRFPDLQLTDPRGLLAATNGQIAVADAELHQILLLDSVGALIRRIGRQGTGPGEFDAVSLVAFWGDSLAAHDPALHRLSVLWADGALIRQRTIDPKGLLSSSIVGFRNGGVPILMGLSIGRTSTTDGSLQTTGLVIALVNEERRDTLAAVEGGHFLSRGPLFFAPRPAAAATDSGLWVGFGGTPEVRFVPFDGSPTRTFRWSATARPVNEADRARVRDYAAARRANPELTGDDRFADSIPYFKSILPDPAGGVWLVGYSALGAAPDSAWRLDDRAGTIQGIELPTGFRPTQIGKDFVLGLRSNEEGDIRVLRYGLTR